MIVRPESAFYAVKPSATGFLVSVSLAASLPAGVANSVFLFLLKFFIFFAEAFDAAGGIDQLLLAGKKRMAF